MAHSPILFGVLLYTAGTLSMKTLDHVTVSEGGTITVPCLYDNHYKLDTKYWCKGYFWYSCKIKARANGTGKWTVTDYPANNIFTVQMNKLTSSDSGFYWCAVETGTGTFKKYLYVTVKKAPDVSVVNSSVSGHKGGDISVQCFYSSEYQNKPKQWCRFEDQSCYTVGRTNTSQNSSVQIRDDGTRNFTVLMTGLRLTDSGWYFCSVGDLQVPVQLHVCRDNEYKTESDAGLSPSICGKQTARNDMEESNCLSEDSSDQMNWTFLLLYTAVPLLMLLMLVLGIWRLIQKHNKALSIRGPDVCSVAESPMSITYDTVVFKKTEDHEQNQVCIRPPPEQVEVIYSTPKLH